MSAITIKPSQDPAKRWPRFTWGTDPKFVNLGMGNQLVWMNAVLVRPDDKTFCVGLLNMGFTAFTAEAAPYTAAVVASRLNLRGDFADDAAGPLADLINAQFGHPGCADTWYLDEYCEAPWKCPESLNVP